MAVTEALRAESAVMAAHPAASPVAIRPPAVDDPSFDHWIVVHGQLIGDAHSVTHGPGHVSFATVRLFRMPDMAAYESIDSERLKPKTGPTSFE